MEAKRTTGETIEVRIIPAEEPRRSLFLRRWIGGGNDAIVLELVLGEVRRALDRATEMLATGCRGPIEAWLPIVDTLATAEVHVSSSNSPRLNRLLAVHGLAIERVRLNLLSWLEGSDDPMYRPALLAEEMRELDELASRMAEDAWRLAAAEDAAESAEEWFSLADVNARGIENGECLADAISAARRQGADLNTLEAAISHGSIVHAVRGRAPVTADA